MADGPDPNRLGSRQRGIHLLRVFGVIHCDRRSTQPTAAPLRIKFLARRMSAWLVAPNGGNSRSKAGIAAGTAEGHAQGWCA